MSRSGSGSNNYKVLKTLEIKLLRNEGTGRPSIKCYPKNRWKIRVLQSPALWQLWLGNRQLADIPVCAMVNQNQFILTT